MGKHATELAGLVDRFASRDGVFPTGVPGLTLARFSAPSVPVGVVYEPSLCIIAQGAKDVLLANEVYRYGPAQFLLVSVDLPVAGRIVEASESAPYLGLTISLDSVAIGEMIADGGREDQSEPPPSRGLTVSPVDPAMLDAVGRLVRLLDSPADVPILAPLVLREIYYRLLTGEQGPRLRQIMVGDGQARRVAKAIRRLKERFSEPIRVADLAREVRMSASGLHHHFKVVTAMSPLQYQKRLRLQEARRLMLSEGMDASSAAFRVGYESPSQFSREYRRLFGQPPRRDVEMLREAAQPRVESVG